MFKCPNCNGSLIFDISTQAMRCLHCGSTMPAESGRESDNSAEETTDAYGVEVYRCPNCNAELVTPETSVVGFCNYCGSELVLQKEMGKEKRPRYIIPFQLTKEDCRKRFQKAKRVPYMPADFRNPDFLENFRGIYMPYWMYDIGYENSVKLPATKKYSRGDYEYTDHYDIDVTMKGDTYGVPFDASRYFDDNIARELAPFDKKDLKPFREEYLAGFYADRANVRADKYQKEAVDTATEEIIYGIDDSLKDGVSLNTGNMSSLSKKIGAVVKNSDFVLFPIWFLTWRKKDRVAYAVVNGQSGKVSFDMPVDIGKMLIGIAITAAALFFVLNSFLAFTAKKMLMIFSVLISMIGILVQSEISVIHSRDMHLKDRGFGSVKMKHEIKNNDTATAVTLIGAVTVMLIGAVGDFMFETNGIITSCAGLLINIAVVYNARKYCANLHRYDLLAGPVVLALSSLIIVMMFVLKPVSDLYYYGAAIASLAGTLATCMMLIINYNLVATRPMPTFTDRKGGDNSAKDY